MQFLSHLTCLNHFPKKPWFLRVCNTNHFKSLWEKEELLVTSNFSFSTVLLSNWRTFCHFHQVKKLLSANSFSLVGVQSLLLEKGLIFFRLVKVLTILDKIMIWSLKVLINLSISNSIHFKFKLSSDQ